ncbi:response regulator [Methylobacterium nigriterrae]|uniref:response regulator n=1 Tax=Methylobacterium nigriterrae TaxID=3127512 RepID=UPI003014191A
MLDSWRIPLRVLNAAQLAGVAALVFALACSAFALSAARDGDEAARGAALTAARTFAEAIDRGLHEIDADARTAALLIRPTEAVSSDADRSALLEEWLAIRANYREAIVFGTDGLVRIASDPRRLGTTLARQPWFARIRGTPIAVVSGSDAGDAADGFDIVVSLGAPGQADRLLLRVGPGFFAGIEAHVRRSLGRSEADARFSVRGADGRLLAGSQDGATAAPSVDVSAPTRGDADLASPGWMVSVRATRDAGPAPGAVMLVLGLGLALVLAAGGAGYCLAAPVALRLRRLADAPAAEPAGTRLRELDDLARAILGRARSSECELAGAGTGLERIRGRLETFEAMSGWSCWEVDPRTKRVVWSDRDCAAALAGIDRTVDLTDLADRIEAADRPLLDQTMRAALEADGPHDVVLRTRSDAPEAAARRVLVRFLRGPAREGSPRRLHALSRELHDAEADAALAPNAVERRRSHVLRRMTDGIVHDFNDILTIVLANLGALKRRHALEIEPTRLVDAALAGALRGSALTRRMLSFVRSDGSGAAESDLAGLVSAFLPFAQANVLRGTPVIDRVPHDLPKVLCSERLIEVTLLNIAFHIRELGLHGFAIGAAAHPADAGTGLDLPSGPYVRLLLASGRPGTGRPPAAPDPTYLETVARLLAEIRGGWRLVDDGTGEAAFLAEIWLPAGDKASVPAAPSWETTLRILLVESDSLVRASLAEALVDLGHDVVQAASGEHALAMLGERSDYDAMIADQSMPAMTGLQLAATVVERHPGIRVILASPHGQLPAAARRFLQLEKPFRHEDLAAVLGGATAQRTAEAA